MGVIHSFHQGGVALAVDVISEMRLGLLPTISPTGYVATLITGNLHASITYWTAIRRYRSMSCEGCYDRPVTKALIGASCAPSSPLSGHPAAPCSQGRTRGPHTSNATLSWP